MTDPNITLLWLKRDLRVADHPALALAAAQGGAVVPLYIVEPEMWAQPDASARQWRFVAESLQSLRADFAALGAPLQVRHGAALEVLACICAEHGITRIISHEETGTGWSFARDQRVAAWARGQGIIWNEVAQMGVVRRLPSRDGWAARRERVVRAPQLPAPSALRGLGEGPWDLPEARDMGLRWDPCPGRQRGGRDAALMLLGSFLTERGQTYRAAMASPLEGAAACSRLSPHLAWGTLSVREAHQAGLARRAEAPKGDWGRAMQSFVSRLAWRDHFMQKLEDAPDLDRRCLHSAYEGLRCTDAMRLAAWEKGETGVPFVDACMRSLIHTGWLNFRMRAMLVAVASYHLWLDWRSTGPHLARMFTDYEPGIHWSQMQMQSGTTGINTPRIYNPVKQGQDQDPTGRFTRTWVPELAEVPDAMLQTPWVWQGAARLAYPAPIVDVTEAARAARDRVWAVRRSERFGAEARQIIHKHASRKDGTGRFVNDRARTSPRAKPASNQMNFDF
jgi:deoxyribodipyrimidine photo-lyase